MLTWTNRYVTRRNSTKKKNSNCRGRLSKLLTFCDWTWLCYCTSLCRRRRRGTSSPTNQPDVLVYGRESGTIIPSLSNSESPPGAVSTNRPIRSPSPPQSTPPIRSPSLPQIEYFHSPWAYRPHAPEALLDQSHVPEHFMPENET